MPGALKSLKIRPQAFSPFTHVLRRTLVAKAELYCDKDRAVEVGPPSPMSYPLLPSSMVGRDIQCKREVRREMSKQRGERRDRGGRGGRDIEGGSERERDREAERGKGNREAERKKSLI